jgi:hypothetical protein
MAKSFLLEGGAQIYAEQIFKRLKADRKLARRWQSARQKQAKMQHNINTRAKAHNVTGAR